MEIQLFDSNLGTPTLVDVLTTKVQNLTFSTKLNGGYFTCSFQLIADIPAAWEYLNNKVFYRLVVTDKQKTLFEGRLEDSEMSHGAIRLTAYGYYANLSDVPYATAYNDVASVVIKAVLTANCTQISSDQTHIAATDITITSAGDDSYLDIYPSAIIEKLLAFSDSTNGKWYFGIWESRIPWLTKRSVSAVTWQVRLADLARFSMRYRAGDLWNSAYTVYDVAGTLTRTAVANDTTSQTKYGLTRQKVIPNIGTVAAAAAQAQRDYWVTEYPNIYPKFSQVSLGNWVWDTKGVRYPSSWVRAGEVVRILDLIPASADLDSVTRNRRNTFFITETVYDTMRRENALTFDLPAETLAAILARRL